MTFWIFLVATIYPEPKFRWRICIGALLATCLIEFGQLWNPEILANFRSTGLGAALIGNSFGWDDFPPYFIGGVIGWAILWVCPRSERLKVNTYLLPGLGHVFAQ